MKSDLFKTLLQSFIETKDVDAKVDLLLTYDLKTLTNPQIAKILDGLDNLEMSKLVSAINKKIEE